MNVSTTNEYLEWIKQVKLKIATVQLKVALSANSELVQLYWFLGNEIVKKQKLSTWGSGFINQFSKDIKIEFPNLSGFSPKNLRYCRAFYTFYNDLTIWQQAVAKLEKQVLSEKWQQVNANLKDEKLIDLISMFCGQIPWGHNIHIFTKSQSLEEALFYILNVTENGWSRDVLALQIKSDLYSRQGKAITNFTNTLPAQQSDLAKQTLKDPYTFDFLSMTKPFNELDVEKKLVSHITKFLLELGKGFAFIGRQYHIEVGENDYYIDLLFYHTKLKCYVVVEIKNRKFIPEYAGKLNFYLSAVDSLIKSKDDNSTIGLLLCRDKDNVEVEFALRDMNKPMGVSEYSITEKLPDNLKGSLPTIEEIEADIKLLENTDDQNSEDNNND